MRPTEGDNPAFVTIGTLIDQDPNASPATDYVGTQINWGDGTPPTDAQFIPTSVDAYGNSIPAGSSAFVVGAVHAYGEDGTFTASTTVTDDGGISAPGSTSVTVADAQLQITGQSLDLTEWQPYDSTNGPIGVLTDSNPNATIADFPAGSVVVNWGDGQTSPASLVPQGGGIFQIALPGDPHTYDSPGTYSAQISASDLGGRSTSATQPAAVGSAQLKLVNGNITDPNSKKTIVGTVTDGTVTLDRGSDGKHLYNWSIRTASRSIKPGLKLALQRSIQSTTEILAGASERQTQMVWHPYTS